MNQQEWLEWRRGGIGSSDADEMNLNTEQFINELKILISLINQAENTINKLSKEKQYD
jgi:hypothetical protein